MTKRTRYPCLANALLALGTTRLERAQRLNVNPKTLDRLLDRLPAAMRPFEQAPHLLRALADDLERTRDSV